RVNFDGVLTLAKPDAPHRAYVQIFRSGIIEAVEASIVTRATPEFQTERVRASLLEDYLIDSSALYLKAAHDLGIEPPYAVMPSLVDLAGLPISASRRPYTQSFDHWGHLDRAQYELDEVIFENVPETPEICARTLRPVLNQLANAAGQAASE